MRQRVDLVHWYIQSDICLKRLRRFVLSIWKIKNGGKRRKNKQMEQEEHQIIAEALKNEADVWAEVAEEAEKDLI